MSDALISIIVPVYDSENTLHRCIDSILGQTYQNFELLLINDGSKDRSGEICDEYATIDSRVRVFHKENGGVSSARNLGLENIFGEWVAFIDSDDWVSEDYLYCLYTAAVSSGCPLVTCDFIEIKTDYTRKCNSFDWTGNGGVNIDFLNRDERIKAVSCLSYGVVWNVLVSRDLIDQSSIRFDTTLKNGEDTLFLLNLHLEVERHCHLKKCLYYYDRTKVTSASNNKTLDYHLNRLNFACKCLILFSNANLQISLDFAYLKIIEYSYELIIAPSSYSSIKRALGLLPKGFPMKCSQVPFKRRIVLWLILNNYTNIIRRLIKRSPYYIEN